jgi:protein-S-isoprenylcysteine O-methyltransferase Ste14
MNLIKSVFHNIGVCVVSFAFALVGIGLDHVLGISRFYSPFAMPVGSLLLIAGFLLRVWATYHFYQRSMKVIVLSAQQSLITDGPYRFSRNPLYLGGNVCMFLGATLIVGSPSGIVLTIAQLPLVDIMIRREEKQLEKKFGDEWIRYARKVRRWL